MSLLCFLGRHRPLSISLTRDKQRRYKALCASCGRPLERSENGSWQASEPLYANPYARER